jgi:TPP-dependent indolepyruvate ferredoxin oxidoreductase alpha subunit
MHDNRYDGQEDNNLMKKALQGNEAIARGAWEAGVTVACAYPGCGLCAQVCKFKSILPGKAGA